MKRLAAPKAIPITDKKAHTWIMKAEPGPHSGLHSMSITVFLRDILKVARTSADVKKVLSKRLVYVDGVSRVSEKFPIGFMDVVSFPSLEKYYRIVLDYKGRLVPIEISKDEATRKILKVTGKTTAPKGKIALSFHDGRYLLGDNNVHVGDSVIVGLPSGKQSGVLRLEKGARCLVREGAHAGTIAKLDEFLNKKAGSAPEVRMSAKSGDFITVARYLFVVDETIKESGHKEE